MFYFLLNSSVNPYSAHDSIFVWLHIYKTEIEKDYSQDNCHEKIEPSGRLEINDGDLYVVLDLSDGAAPGFHYPCVFSFWISITWVLYAGL